jgi:hypothetical protein
MTTDSSPYPGDSRKVRQATVGGRRGVWAEPRPERIPPATFAPAALALGVTLLAFGAVTSPILSVVGGLLTCVASLRWIKEIHDAAER